MIKLVKDVMVEKKWIADERKEIEGRKEEYMRRWRELWNLGLADTNYYT